MLKSILNLKGAQQLSKKDQEIIHGGKAYRPSPIVIGGGGSGPSTCQIGCQGLSQGDDCYASANCGCPGGCSGGTCIPF